MDGCKNYKILNGVDRARGYTLPSQQRCDSDMELSWYRFQGLAGDQMADTCVSMLRCGTVASGWLSGAHPTVADGAVVRKVCYNWLSCCGHSDHIKVRNCGAFFVYELKKPPSCNMRYCGNGSARRLLCWLLLSACLFKCLYLLCFIESTGERDIEIEKKSVYRFFFFFFTTFYPSESVKFHFRFGQKLRGLGSATR